MFPTDYWCQGALGALELQPSGTVENCKRLRNNNEVIRCQIERKLGNGEWKIVDEVKDGQVPVEGDGG